MLSLCNSWKTIYYDYYNATKHTLIQISRVYRGTKLKAYFSFYCILLLSLFQGQVDASSKDSFYEYDNAKQSMDFYCYSCASTSYLQVWNNQLVGHYFPPKNFTEHCWNPDQQVGLTFCTSACFTIVEEIHAHTTQEAVMRGCMDRFLLFGLDTDIKIAIANLRDRVCRTMDRRLMNLVPLNHDVPLILICTCGGNLCNNDYVEASSHRLKAMNVYNLFIIILILHLFLRK